MIFEYFDEKFIEGKINKRFGYGNLVKILNNSVRSVFFICFFIIFKDLIFIYKLVYDSYCLMIEKCCVFVS